MAIITTNTGGGAGSAGGGFTSVEKLSLELELAFKASTPNVKKEFGYDTTSGNLNSIIIYEYDTTTVLFTKILDYDGQDNLIKITVTRITDSVTLIKNLTYDVDGNLTIIMSIHNSP